MYRKRKEKKKVNIFSNSTAHAHISSRVIKEKVLMEVVTHHYQENRIMI
jgi:hypothetical protein